MSILVNDVSKYGWEPETFEKIKKRLFKGVIEEVDRGHFNSSLVIRMKKYGRELLFTGMVSNKVVDKLGLKKGDKVYVLLEPETESFTVFKTK
ncbi:hypothetical protein [Desulfurobacterium sp.]